MEEKRRSGGGKKRRTYVNTNVLGFLPQHGLADADNTGPFFVETRNKNYLMWLPIQDLLKILLARHYILKRMSVVLLNFLSLYKKTPKSPENSENYLLWSKNTKISLNGKKRDTSMSAELSNALINFSTFT